MRDTTRAKCLRTNERDIRTGPIQGEGTRYIVLNKLRPEDLRGARVYPLRSPVDIGMELTI